jgi:hypothetical protein
MFLWVWQGNAGQELRVCAESHGFPLATSGHQFVDGFSRRLSAIQDGVHLSGNRHFHMVDTRQFDRGMGGKNALGDHAMHACNDVGQFTSASEFHSDAAIA